MSPVSQAPYRPFPTFSQFTEAPVEFTAYEVFQAQLLDLKEGTDPARLNAAVLHATRAAAADTGAIEGLYEINRGFTLSIATEAAAWDTISKAMGKDVARTMNDALRGYEYALDFVTGARPLSEAWIRELHSILCASQKTFRVITEQGPQDHPLPLGKYKEVPNNPINLSTAELHSYAPVEGTPAEMARLVSEMSAMEFTEAHPVLQAAYAHYAFVCVHPFADGNGRVARALASIYLYRSPGVPLVVFADQKPEYLNSLELADAGDPLGFIRFVGDRAVDAARMVIDDIRYAIPEKDRADRTERLRSSLLGRQGLTHQEIDALAILLLEEFGKACMNANTELPAPGSIEIQVQRYGGTTASPIGHLRAVPGSGEFVLLAKVAPPADIQTTISIKVLAAKPSFTGYDLALVSDTTVVGEFLLRDLHPQISGSTSYRLGGIAEAQLWRLTEDAARAAERVLSDKGYL